MHLPKIDYNHFIELLSPQTTPEISILMPLYNQKEYIESSISSVLAQRGICAEIIISDDASKDGTFEEALRVISKWLEKHECGHKIVVRRGKQRLWRDHLPLLVDNACCDLVCQSHGDDISATDRCLKLFCVFKAEPLISLVGSESSSFISSQKQGWGIRATDGCENLYQYTYNEIIDGQYCLIGAFLAWRKSAVNYFARLDSQFSAVAHDRILAFRSSLTGKVMLLQSPLVKKRKHLFQSRNWLFHEPYKHCSFGSSLERISVLWAMKRDLYKAADLGLISLEKKNMLEGEINKRLDVFQQSLIESYRIYTHDRKHIAWVDDDTIQSMNINFIDKIKLYVEKIIKMTLTKRQASVFLNFIRGFTAKWRRIKEHC